MTKLTGRNVFTTIEVDHIILEVNCDIALCDGEIDDITVRYAEDIYSGERVTLTDEIVQEAERLIENGEWRG